MKLAPPDVSRELANKLRDALRPYRAVVVFMDSDCTGLGVIFNTDSAVALIMLETAVAVQRRGNLTIVDLPPDPNGAPS